MINGKSLNPEINTVLSKIGHTQTLAIVDAGFPISDDEKRIDLAWTDGKPAWLEICAFLKENLITEKIYLATEMCEKSKEAHDEFVKLFDKTNIEYVSHENLKKISKESRAIIRTGEFTPFCNCVLVSGVSF